MALSNISMAEIGKALGVPWRSEPSLNAAEKIITIAKNTKSQAKSDMLVRAYLKLERRKLGEAKKHASTVLPASDPQLPL